MMTHNDESDSDDDNGYEVIYQNELQDADDKLYVNFFKIIKELKACKKTSKANLKRTNELIK